MAELDVEPGKSASVGRRASGGARPARTPAVTGLQQVTVLGMHRSGTSAMAGALVSAGGWAGDSEQLMPADDFNAKGYFERHDTSVALDGVLADLGGSWHTPPFRSLDRLSLEPTRDRLRSLFDAVAEGVPDGRIPVVKDPRLSLFSSELPTVLGSTEGIVVCVRHPLSVARSLRRAHGIPISQGLALWELHNAAICKGLSGRAVRVRAFGQDAAEQMSLPSFVDGVMAAFPRVVRPVEQEDSWAPDLLHGYADAEDEQQWLTAAQVSLWQALAEAARSPQPTALEAVELSALAAQELGRAAKAQADHDAWVADQAASSAALSALREDRDGVRAELERERVESAVERERLAAEVQSWQEAGTRLEISASDHARQAAQLQAEASQAQTQLDAAREEVTVLAAERASLAAALDVEQETAASLRQEHAAAVRAAEASEAAHRDAESRWETARAEAEQAAGEAARAQAKAAELSSRAAEWGISVSRLALQQRTLMAELETYRGLYEELVTAYGLTTGDMGAPAHHQIQHWLERLHLTQHSPVEPGLVSSADLHEAITQVDLLRGFVEEVQELWLKADPRHTPLSNAELAAWVAKLASGGGSSPSGAGPDVLGPKELERLAAAERELMRLRDHRDEVVRDHLAVMSSQSWKLGHAATWPVRIIRRAAKQESVSKDLKA